MQEGDGKDRDVHVLRASLGITEYTHKFTKWFQPSPIMSTEMEYTDACLGTVRLRAEDEGNPVRTACTRGWGGREAIRLS